MVRGFAHGLIDPSWGGPTELFLVPSSAPRLVNKGCGMCYPVCGMVHIKEPLLLIGKSSTFPSFLFVMYTNVYSDL